MASPLNLFDGVVSFGVKIVNLVDGQNAAQWLARNIFTDNFSTCMQKFFEEIDANFKYYSYLNGSQLHIKAYIKK